MKTDSVPSAAVLLGLAVAAAGCDVAANAANGAGAFVEKTAYTIEQRTADGAITVAVKGALVDADDVLGRQVIVGCSRGVVTLAGTVPTAEGKARAEQLARQARGVVSVVNGITVGPLQ